MRLVLRLAALVVLLALLAFAGAVAYFLREVRTYPPMTFEMAQTDPVQIAEFALDGKWTPEAWKFPDYREETFETQPDGLQLAAWVLQPTGDSSSADSFAAREDRSGGDSLSVSEANPTDCAVVFVHGRWDNRLKALKYLPLVRASGLAGRCLTVFPDLRNSGRSEAGATDMGWQFAEDLTSTLEHLGRTHGTRRVVVYAFSMGAMGTALMMDRPDLVGRRQAARIAIDRVVLDSPMASVAGNVRDRADAMGVPRAVTATTLALFDRVAVDGHLGEMHLGHLLAEVRIPVLVLYSRADVTTPPQIIERERLGFPDNVSVVAFEKAAHVHLVSDPAAASAYRDAVVPFLRAAVPREVDAAAVR